MAAGGLRRAALPRCSKEGAILTTTDDPRLLTASVTYLGDGTAALEVAGEQIALVGGSDRALRRRVMAVVGERAESADKAVLLTAREIGGEGRMLVRPNGVVEAVGSWQRTTAAASLTPGRRPVRTIADDESSAPENPRPDASAQAATIRAAGAPGVPRRTVAAGRLTPDHVLSRIDAAERAVADRAAAEAVVNAAASHAAAEAREQERRETKERREEERAVEEERAAQEHAAAEHRAAEHRAAEERAAEEERAAVLHEATARAARIEAQRAEAGGAGPERAEAQTAVEFRLAADRAAVGSAPAGADRGAVEAALALEDERAEAVDLPPLAVVEASAGVPPRAAVDFRTAFTAPGLPATSGIRGALAHVGILMAPSRVELDERRDLDLVARGWAGSRVVAVVGGSAGAGTTTVTSVLAGRVAPLRAGGVLAWDLAGSGLHPSGTRPAASGPHADFAAAASVVRPDAVVTTHTEDGYAVLHGAAASLHALLTAARDAFPLVLLDAGHTDVDGRAPRAVDVADGLVLVSGTEPDDVAGTHALLRGLQQTPRGAALLADAVMVVPLTARRRTSAVRRALDALEPLVGRAVLLPYDPALRTAVVRAAALDAETRRAALAAAAAAAAAL